MENKKLSKSRGFAEYNVDFALIGKGNNNTFCLQFISNKPAPVVKSIDETDPVNTSVQLEMQSFLSHECTIFMNEEQMTLLKTVIDNALSPENKN